MNKLKAKILRKTWKTRKTKCKNAEMQKQTKIQNFAKIQINTKMQKCRKTTRTTFLFKYLEPHLRCTK